MLYLSGIICLPWTFPKLRNKDSYASIECISLSIIPHLLLCLLLWVRLLGAGVRAAVSMSPSSTPPRPCLPSSLPPVTYSLQSLTPLTSRYLGQLFSICKTCLFFADTMCKPSVPPRKDPTTNFVTVLSHLHSACIAFEELMYSGNSRYVIVVWSVVSKYL